MVLSSSVSLCMVINLSALFNCALFPVTTVPTSWLDGAHVVFGASFVSLENNTSNTHSPVNRSGEVIEGLDLVKTIETHGTASGKTKKTIEIAASGTL